MPLTPVQQAALTAKNRINRRIGQFGGPEFFVNQSVAASTAPILNRQVPIGQPTTGIRIVWRGRIVIATANYTTVGAEAPQCAVQRILVTGPSANFGQQTLWDISGASLFAMARLFQQTGNQLYFGSTAAAYTRTSELSTPMGLAGATFGNTGTYDTEIHYWLPFAPFTVDRNRGLSFALRPEDWPNGLQVQVFVNDYLNCFGTTGSATTTITAFGSASGTPSVNVYLETMNLGEIRTTTPAGICCRQEVPSLNSFVSVVANNLQIINPQRQRITNLIVKQGVINTAAGAGANTFLSLSDFQLGNFLLNYNNTYPRNFQDWFAAKAYYADMFNAGNVQGYLPISFVESGNPFAALDATVLPSGSMFILLAGSLVSTANVQVNCVQEWVLGSPQSRLPGTPATSTVAA